MHAKHQKLLDLIPKAHKDSNKKITFGVRFQVTLILRAYKTAIKRKVTKTKKRKIKMRARVTLILTKMANRSK